MTDSERRFRFVLATMVALLVLNAVGAYLALGWKAITANVLFITLLDLVYAVRFRDRTLAVWMTFALAAGVGELIADWWLVVHTGSLVYPNDEPMIWKSPAYMPLAWMVVLVQVGAVGTWLSERTSLLKASLATGALGGTFIPLYEHMARHGNWWHYVDTPMLFSAPYYVILAEALLALPLVWMMRSAAERGFAWALLLALVETGVILAACWVSWWLLGPCGQAAVAIPCR